MGGTHDGVGRVGLGPPVGFSPLFTPEFSKKEIFGENHDVNPPQVGDLVLVGLDSGLPCHRKEPRYAIADVSTEVGASTERP